MNLQYHGNWFVLFALIILGCMSNVWGKPGVIFDSAKPNCTKIGIEKSNDPILIVAFGNSITAERGSVDQVFAQRLPDILAAKGIQATVVNSGIGGSHTGRRTDHDLFKIRHGRDRFQNDVLDYSPDLVIIGFGTNDSFIDSKSPGGLSRIPLDSYKENLVYYITNLKAIDAKIILMAPNILGANFGDFQNKRLLQYVKVVRKLARKYHTGLVDNYKLFQMYGKQHKVSYEVLMLDGCHPNDDGHMLIAQHLAVEISKLLNVNLSSLPIKLKKQF